MAYLFEEFSSDYENLPMVFMNQHIYWPADGYHEIELDHTTQTRFVQVLDYLYDHLTDKKEIFDRAILLTATYDYFLKHQAVFVEHGLMDLVRGPRLFFIDTSLLKAVFHYFQNELELDRGHPLPDPLKMLNDARCHGKE